MGIKEQFAKIKDNWLIIVLGLVLVFVLLGGLNLGSGIMERSYSVGYGGAYDKSYSSEEYYSPSYNPGSDFAPEVEARKITKTSYLTSEVKRGEFDEARNRLASIITASDAYLLNENVNRYGGDKHTYFVGTYQVKVDATKYDSVISQLKELGEVDSFRESQTDITGSYTDAQIELAAEKARLTRYQAMLEEATLTADKIILSDKIFDQERRVKYLQESLDKMDQRVDYSTIYLTLNEKQSEYANLALVGFSELISGMVSSFNALLSLLFVALPWLIVIALVVIIVRLIKSRRNRQR